MHARPAVFLALAATLAPAQKAPNKLELDLLLDWESVSGPRLSPDGRQIVFSRRWVDKIDDRYASALWIMNADGTRPRFLAKGSSPRWSPDGERIAYLADGEPQGSQIHVMWVDTREVTQITRVDRGPSGIRWSPDGRRIAFGMVVPEKTGFEIKLPKRPRGAKWAEDPKIITRLNYRRDRQGYRPAGFSHLFVVDADGGTPRQVTDGDYDHRSAEWTPDGRSLVFSGLREDDADWQVRESEVYEVAVATGEVTRLTRRKGPDSGPVVSPDGRFVAYTGYDATRDTYEVSKLHVLPLDGSGGPRVLAAGLDRQLRGLMWTKDSRAILSSVGTEGTRQLYRFGLDGSTTAITRGQHAFSASDVSRDGLVVGTHATAYDPGDIATIDLASGEIRTLTRVNADLLAGVTLGEVEEIRYPSPADGLEIQGWIIKPPDFDPAKKYPLILQIHGGPHGMYGVDFNFERQNHAANGYVVLYTNPRGSTGYGKGFGNAINNAYPGLDYDDLMGGVDLALARGYVDPERLYVYGGSGGGVLTAWIVGHTDRFAAAVSMFPVIDWISFVGTTDGPYWYTNFERLPWEDITEHWDRSPLKYAGNVTTPTLLITGELDLRTPMAQTEEFYQALKLRKVDTMMIRVPDEYHGAAGRRVSNVLRRILYVRGWFERHGGGAGAGDVGAIEAAARRGEMSWTGVLDEATFAQLHELKAGEAPALSGEMIDVAGDRAYLSLPEGRTPTAAVLVIHEWWGLNDHVKHWADRLAADGYAALAVDLYSGTIAVTPEQAGAAMRRVDPAAALATLQRAHRFLAEDPRVRAKKRACIGWCFGGGWSLRHAIATPDLDAAVVYYGRTVTDSDQLGRIRAPMLAVYGNQDRGIPPAAVDAFEMAMKDAGRELRVLRYDANHAFANPSSARYDARSAEQAWTEVRKFLAEHLR